VGRQLIRRLAAAALVIVSLGCGSPRPETTPAASVAALPAALAEASAALIADHDAVVVPGLERRQFAPESYWRVLSPILDAAPERFAVQEVGRSVENRPIRRIDFGSGDTAVLLWSQMHGNESTASRTLVDVIRYLRDNASSERVRRIESQLTVTFVPIVNPDGAARFVRHNALGVDLNRDARRLAMPESRALKAVRDDTGATWGFNLHDQNVRTRLGASDRDVLIALLAPPPGQGVVNEVNRRAQRMCSMLVDILRPAVGDQIARYDESFNPRAFGDLMTSWGTSVVLIESGGELEDPNKDRLRRANFVAILSALDAIATGQWEAYSPTAYRRLPLNAPWVYDLIVRGASVVLPGREPLRADLAINFDDTLDGAGPVLAEVGDLEDARALEVIDAEGLYFLPDEDMLARPKGPHLRPGEPLTGRLARDREGSQVVRRIEGDHSTR
jgi:hypothetical protein